MYASLLSKSRSSRIRKVYSNSVCTVIPPPIPLSLSLSSYSSSSSMTSVVSHLHHRHPSRSSKPSVRSFVSVNPFGIPHSSSSRPCTGLLDTTGYISIVTEFFSTRPFSRAFSSSSSSLSSSTIDSSDLNRQISIPSLDDINTIRTSCGLIPLSSDSISTLSKTGTTVTSSSSSASSDTHSDTHPRSLTVSLVQQTLASLRSFHQHTLYPLLPIDHELRSQLLLASIQTVIDLAYALSSATTPTATSTPSTTTTNKHNNPSTVLGTEPFLSSLLIILQGFTPLAYQCATLLQEHKGTHIPTLRADHYSVPTDQVILLGGTRLSEILQGSTMNSKPSSSSSSSASSSLPYYEQREQWSKELNKEEVHLIAPLLRILYQLTNISQDPLNGGGGFAIVYGTILHLCILAGSSAALTACVRVLASRDLRVASIHPLKYLSYSREISRRNELQANVQGSSGNAIFRQRKKSSATTNRNTFVPSSSTTTTASTKALPVPPSVPVLAYNHEQWDTLLSGFTHLLITPASSLILQYVQTMVSSVPSPSSSSLSPGSPSSKTDTDETFNQELINHLLLQEYPKVYVQYINMATTSNSTVTNNTSNHNNVTDYVTIQLIQEFFTNYLVPKSTTSSSTTTTVTVAQYQSWLQLLENTFAPYILMYCSNNQLPLAVKYMDTCQALMQWLPVPSSPTSSSSTSSSSTASRSATIVPVPLPQPSAEIWEALVEACCRLGQPNRAKRILQSMVQTGIQPTKRYTSIQANILVSLANKSGKETEVFAIFMQMQEEVEKLGYRLPASAYLAVMEAMLRIGETDQCYDILRMAQRKGILRSIDNELLTKGILNLSGLSSSLLATILYQSLTNLRNYCIENQLKGAQYRTVSGNPTTIADTKTTTNTATPPPVIPTVPTSLRIYHRAADRLHIRGLLQGINPPLEARTEGKSGKERYLLIDETHFFQWLNSRM